MTITMISEHLVAHLPVMENVHLLLLLRYFAEPFLLNTLPMFYRYSSLYHHAPSLHLSSIHHHTIIIPPSIHHNALPIISSSRQQSSAFPVCSTIFYLPEDIHRLATFQIASSTAQQWGRLPLLLSSLSTVQVSCDLYWRRYRFLLPEKRL